MSDYSPSGTPKKPTQPKPEKDFTTDTAESIRHYLGRIFNLQSNVNKTKTKEEIKENIGFGGIQVYILIASILIASIGLNANSTAVVIGAMLISPLMGPIVGFGYSIGVNDYISLRRSLMNFLVMVVISLLTSYLYFELIPGGERLTSELRGRIEPTILDVMIAISGGVAGILGASSKNKNINVVAGVAIATALMPPLCTVGFGLAVGFDEVKENFNGFKVARNSFYLFFINSTFIALSTFLFIKLLRFPLARYQDAATRRRTNIYIVLAAIVVLVPSIFLFSDIFRATQKKFKILNFLEKEVEVNYGDSFIDLDDPKIDDKTNDSLTIVTIRAIGEIPPNAEKDWNREMLENYGIQNTRLNIWRGGGVSTEEMEELSQKSVQGLFQTTQQQILEKDSIINSLENQLARLQSDSIPFRTISQELKQQYEGLENFGFGNYNYTDFKRKEVIPTFVLEWKADSITKLDPKKRKENEERIKKFLKARLKLDTIQVLR